MELLQQRLDRLEAERQQAQARLHDRQQALLQAQAKQAELERMRQQAHNEVERLQAEYARRGRAERPHSHLAQARAHLAVLQRRQERHSGRCQQGQRQVDRQQAQLSQMSTTETALAERGRGYEHDKATNPGPLQAVFRLDAGFSRGENVALLIELGYEVYSKPYSHQVTRRLRRQVSPSAAWTRVGANAEMVALPPQALAGCPYPLDLALERCYTGQTQRDGTLLHFGRDPVLADLPQWFQTSNGRQTIEAGIKEGQNVFQMHHLKVRSPPALLRQEHLAAFAANFVRWAAHWLVTDCQQVVQHASSAPSGVKEAVQVGAHTSAWVKRLAGGWLIPFTDHSAYAGRVLFTGARVFQLPLPLFKSCGYSTG